MTVLAAMGGIGANHFLLRSRKVPTAPMRLARVPKTISGRAQPVTILEIRHPMVMPGMAAGVKNGKMVSASEKRT